MAALNSITLDVGDIAAAQIKIANQVYVTSSSAGSD
jgi:hypothetical protein